MKISDALLPEFDQEMAKTRKLLERIPQDKFSFKPHPKSFDMISLASHISNMVGWIVDTMSKDSFDVQPPGAPPYKEEPAANPAALVEKFDSNVAAGRAALAGAGDGDFMANWSLMQGGNVLFTMPRVVCVRAFIFNHIIHHRGQLSVYLRLNDIPVPSIYGPSADEAM